MTSAVAHHECAWCGGVYFTAYRNRRGEVFCSAGHRSSSNRALRRLQVRKLAAQQEPNGA